MIEELNNVGAADVAGIDVRRRALEDLPAQWRVIRRLAAIAASTDREVAAAAVRFAEAEAAWDAAEAARDEFEADSAFDFLEAATEREMEARLELDAAKAAIAASRPRTLGGLALKLFVAAAVTGALDLPRCEPNERLAEAALADAFALAGA